MPKTACPPARGERVNVMKQILHFLCTSLLLALSVAGAQPPTPSKTELERLQGEWKVVTIAMYGGKVPKELLEKITVSISDDKFTMDPFYFVNLEPQTKGGELEFLLQEKSMELEIRLDISKSPKEMDLATVKQPKQNLKGIYSVSDDSLRICFSGQKRPKDFTEGGKEKVILWEFARPQRKKKLTGIAGW